MKFSKCLDCDGILKDKLITWEEYVEGKKITIPNVPAAVCENCGKRYIHDDATKFIEEEKKKTQSGDELIVSLKEVRKARGLTQAEVSSRMGFTVARYSDIENNRKKPSILLALKLARALECNISEIYRLAD